jgi:hypothetical protein
MHEVDGLARELEEGSIYEGMQRHRHKGVVVNLGNVASDFTLSICCVFVASKVGWDDYRPNLHSSLVFLFEFLLVW